MSLVFRGFSSIVNVNGGVIDADGEVMITADSTAESDIEATAVASPEIPIGVAIGFTRSSARAETNVNGTTTITADGDVLIKSNATAQATVSAETQSNIDEEGDDVNATANSIAAAITSTDLDSVADVGQNVTITSANDNINVIADGDVTSEPSATASTFSDGLTGITVALGFDDSDVTSTVNGTLTAKGANAEIAFDPTQSVTVSLFANTITIPNHGLKTGDRIVYRNGGDADFGGLEDGESFHVIVLDANTVQLARAAGIDLDNRGVDATATHTLNRFALRDFTPGSMGVVNGDTNRLTIGGHGFSDGQRVIYSANGNGVVTGLTPGRAYLIDSANSNSFRLRREDTNALADLIVDENTNFEGEHSFLFEETAKGFNPSSNVDSANDLITINGHGFSTGDSVFYRTDPSKTTTTMQGYGGSMQNVTMQDAEIRGLRGGDILFVSVVDANTIRLTDSSAAAKHAVAIDLTSTGSGSDHGFDVGLTSGVGVSANLMASNAVNTSSSLGDDPPDEAEDEVNDSAGDFSRLLPFDASRRSTPSTSTRTPLALAGLSTRHRRTMQSSLNKPRRRASIC